jgi:hypothetical protein
MASGFEAYNSMAFNQSTRFSQSNIKERLGSKVRSPYTDIFPIPSSHKPSFHDTNILNINNDERLSDDSGKQCDKLTNSVENININSLQNERSPNNIELSTEFLIKTTKSMNFCLQTNFNEKHETTLLMNKIELNNTTNWIIDSGATIHMTNREEILSGFISHKKHFVTISDGTKIPIEGFGILKFKLKDKFNTVHTFELSPVAYIPKLAVNLLSVEALTRLKVSVLFDSKACKVLHGDGEILIGNRVNSSYVKKRTYVYMNGTFA